MNAVCSVLHPIMYVLECKAMLHSDFCKDMTLNKDAGEQPICIFFDANMVRRLRLRQPSNNELFCDGFAASVCVHGVLKYSCSLVRGMENSSSMMSVLAMKKTL